MKNKVCELVRKYNEVIKYLIIGVLTTVVSFVTYWLFSRGLNINYKVSTILSWIVTVTFAFLANKIIVFRSKTSGKKDLLLEIINFFKYRILSLLVDFLMMVVFVEVVNINDLIAKIIVQFVIVVINYVFSKFFVFNNTKKKEIKVNLDNKDKMYIVGSLLVLLILFGIFVHDHFAMDTVVLYNIGYSNNAHTYLNNGRILMYLFLMIMDYLELPFIVCKQLAWLLGLASIWCAIINLYLLLKKYTKNSLVNIITSFLIACSLFTVELFSFPEFTGITCFGVLAAILSSIHIVNFFEHHDKKYILKALLFATIAMFSYQSVMSFVVVISIAFALKYSTKISDFIKNNLLIAFVYGSACLLGLIYTALNGSDRVSGSIYLKDSIISILSQAKSLMWTTQNILPSYMYAIIVLLIGVLLIVEIYKEKSKKSYIKFWFLVYCSIAMVVVPLVPFVLVNTNNIGICGRTVISMGSLVGLLFLFYIVNIKNNRLFEWLSVGVFTILLIFASYSYHEIAINRFIINKGDEDLTNEIIKIIEDYESNSNIEIKNMGLINDLNITLTYSGSQYINNMTQRAMTVDWSTMYYFRYFLNRDIKHIQNVNIPKEIKEICSNNDWVEFDEEQIIFEEDTVYICIY